MQFSACTFHPTSVFKISCLLFPVTSQQFFSFHQQNPAPEIYYTTKNLAFPSFPFCCSISRSSFLSSNILPHLVPLFQYFLPTSQPFLFLKKMIPSVTHFVSCLHKSLSQYLPAGPLPFQHDLDFCRFIYVIIPYRHFYAYRPHLPYVYISLLQCFLIYLFYYVQSFALESFVWLLPPETV